MSKSESDLTIKQAAAIEALLTCPTREEAAKKASIGRATLTRWLADASFQTAYQKAKNETIDSILTALQGAAIKAVCTLNNVMDDDEAKPSERVAAARCVLDNLLRSREALDIEERLRALEQKQVGSYKPSSQWTN
jgi:hypothetical protein